MIATTALLASAAVTWAQDAPGTPTAPAEQPSAAVSALTPEQAIAMTENVFSVMKELTATLKQVKDKGTADASAPKVKELVSRLAEAQAKATEAGEPSKEVLDAVQAHFQGKEDETAQLMQEFVGAMFPLMLGNGETPFFGSEALQNAMAPLMEQNAGE